MRTLEVIDRELEQVRRELDRAKKLDAMIRDMQDQYGQRRMAVEDALEVMRREQEDVEELERISFASFLAKIRGNQDERLDQERREAVAAKARCDAARWDLEDLAARLSAAREERSPLDGREERYRVLLAEKEEILRRTGGTRGARLAEIARELGEGVGRLRELDEAVCAGNEAVYALEQMGERLDSAADWGAWDILGGGMLVTMAKHSSMDEAQRCAARARQALSRFRTELADVSPDQVPEAGLDGFTTFADYFFDGLIADLFVQSKIENARAGVGEAVHRVGGLMEQLRREQSQQEELAQALTREREALLTGM